MMSGPGGYALVLFQNIWIKDLLNLALTFRMSRQLYCTINKFIRADDELFEIKPLE